MKLHVIRFAGLFLLLAWGGSPVSAENADPDAAGLARLQTYMDSLRSLRAGFEQALFDADGQLIQRSSGTLRMRRPGLFRWDYSAPFEQSIVADGERLWIYDADLEQVTVRTLEKSLSSTPAMLLSGGGRIAEGYSFQDSFTAEGMEWTEIAPRESDTDFRMVRLGFREGELAVMDLVDSLGQTTRIRFSDVESNPDLDASVFRFVVPKGADVIGADDL